jgi:D-alanyl-D-alanine carboxypeptidase
MKTGFICASGFNLVATATRNNKRLIAVVLGAPSSTARAMKAAQLLELGFSQGPLSWLVPSLGTVDALQPVNVDPPNLRDEMCGGHRKRPATEEDPADLAGVSTGPESGYGVFLSALRAPTGKGAALLQDVNLGEPVVVFTGPPKAQGQIATVDPKPAKGAAKPAAVPAAAAAVPWVNRPATSKAALAPTETIEPAIPLPSKRPGAPAQPSATPKPQKPAQQTALAPKPQAGAKPATKPAPKSGEKPTDKQ